MSTWHITPEYINAEWTEEQFLLLFKMRNRRLSYENGKKPKKRGPMSATDFSKAFGVDIVVVKQDKE